MGHSIKFHTVHNHGVSRKASITFQIGWGRFDLVNTDLANTVQYNILLHNFIYKNINRTITTTTKIGPERPVSDDVLAVTYTAPTLKVSEQFGRTIVVLLQRPVASARETGSLIAL